ncbi:MFS transporter [Nonomuraea sp. NPDC050663]|uniref:MFS transporter n=1 Tax=Nonomuraea sp. NPDC050663 TaxID=3364370 RepID=UPI0037BC55D8
MYVATPQLNRLRLLLAVPGNVAALGAVSLVTDISSEMITAILPYYLVLVVGLSPLAYGLVDGLYFGVTALVRLGAGYAADRWQRRKLVAGIGYGLSALSRLGLLAAGASVPALGAAVAVDRAGKGLRTAPRDALISLSAEPGRQGQAFGVHRAMDTIGAFLGPLAAFGLLALGGAYDLVFVASFALGLLGVVLLVLYVRDHRTPAPLTLVGAAPSGVAPSMPSMPSMPVGERRPGLRLPADPRFRRILLLACLLGLLTLSDAFIYLLLQDRVAPEFFPLLPLGTALVYLLTAVPVGRLADRYGRMPVFLAGHGLLLALYGLLAWQAHALVILVLLGLFYAATDGVLMAAAGPLLPDATRTSGLAWLQTGQAVARMLSSILFGALWTVLG